jgi:YfiH family protein
MVHPVVIGELAALPGIAHGFFTRRGGVSIGIYASLNCGVGASDSPEAVRENRARVAARLGAGKLVSAYQVHGTAAVTVDAGATDDPARRAKADVLVTATRGVALGVLTADCAPILLADPGAGVVGAAHAGWRGALAGVAEAAVAAMEELGAARGRIHAAVGPCIGAGAYEVGPELEASFLQQDAANARFFTRPSGQDRAHERPHFDLSGYVGSRLQGAGLAAVGATGICSYVAAEEFFSYRRSRQRGEADYGRQISAIVLT